MDLADFEKYDHPERAFNSFQLYGAYLRRVIPNYDRKAKTAFDNTELARDLESELQLLFLGQSFFSSSSTWADANDPDGFGAWGHNLRVFEDKFNF